MPLHTFSFAIKTVKKILLPFLFLFINPVYSQVSDSVLIENIYYKGWQYIYTNPDSATSFFENAKKESENRKYFPGMVMYHNYNASAIQSAWTAAMDKVDLQMSVERIQNFEEAFNRIKAATGVNDIEELVRTFIKNEDQNFSLFNYVNEQQNEIEKLEEQLQVRQRSHSLCTC